MMGQGISPESVLLRRVVARLRIVRNGLFALRDLCTSVAIRVCNSRSSGGLGVQVPPGCSSRRSRSLCEHPPWWPGKNHNRRDPADSSADGESACREAGYFAEKRAAHVTDFLTATSTTSGEAGCFFEPARFADRPFVVSLPRLRASACTNRDPRRDRPATRAKPRVLFVIMYLRLQGLLPG